MNAKTRIGTKGSRADQSSGEFLGGALQFLARGRKVVAVNFGDRRH